MTHSERWDAFIDELRTYVQEHHHFPNKHTRLLSKVKYTVSVHFSALAFQYGCHNRIGSGILKDERRRFGAGFVRNETNCYVKNV